MNPEQSAESVADDGYRGPRCLSRTWGRDGWYSCALAKGHWGNHAPRIDTIEEASSPSWVRLIDGDVSE